MHTCKNSLRLLATSSCGLLKPSTPRFTPVTSSARSPHHVPWPFNADSPPALSINPDEITLHYKIPQGKFHTLPRSVIAASNAASRLPQTQALRNGDRRLSDPAGCRIIWRQGGAGGGGVECKAFFGSSRRGSGTQWFEVVGAAAYGRAGTVGCGGVYCVHQANHGGARQNLTRARLLNLVFFTCTFLQCFFPF
jgi:hypothetical protein